MAAGPWRGATLLQHGQQDAGAPKDDWEAHGPAAILAAGPWPAGRPRERRHLGGRTLAWKAASPPSYNHGQQDAGAPKDDWEAHGPAGRPRERRHLGGRTLAWTQLQHTSPRRPAGCWRSQGRLGSTRPGRMTPGAPPSWRQEKTAPPPSPTTASRMLALPRTIGLEGGVSPTTRPAGPSYNKASQDAGAPRGAAPRGGALIPAVGVYLFRRWCVRLCRPSNDGRA